MRKLESCRLSRIFEKKVFERAKLGAFLFFVFIFVAGLSFGTISSFFIGGVFLLLSLGAGIWTFYQIFLADDYYELKKFDKKGKVKIYIYEEYNKKAKYQICVESPYLNDAFCVDKYEFFKIGKKRDWFIFALRDDWFCLYFDEIIPLGKRFGRAVFVDKDSNDKRFRISALSLKNEIKTYMADCYFFGDEELYIPDLLDKEHKNTDYVLIKTDGEYKLISSLHILKKKREMMIAGVEKYRSVIFKENGENVVVVWDEPKKAFKEIYRGVNKVDSLKCIVETENKDFPCIASIYKFDRRRKTLMEVYKGEISFIDKENRFLLGKGDDDFFEY